MHSVPTAIPTAGYPSQKAAILALHVQRMPSRVIASTLGVPLNTVTSKICTFRKTTGKRIEPVGNPERAHSIGPVKSVWDMSDGRRRTAFARHAAAGAKQTLEGFNPPKPTKTLRQAILDGYRDGTPLAVIASECGSTRGTVKTTAHKMGLRHPRYGFKKRAAGQ